MSSLILNSIINLLIEKYNINQGGCVFLTYCLAKYCEKNNLKYKILVSKHKCNIDNKNSILCKDKLNNNIPCTLYCIWSTPSHFFIKINDIIYNQWSTIDYDEYNLTSEELKIIYESGRWNNKFNKENIPHILNLFNQFNLL
jgi:hypothetical protein